jgi:glycosyltransferase involved in cell wall biosynthesis
MKIVFLCEAVFPENKGGVERWFSQISKELARRGHEVHYLNATGVNGVRDSVRYRAITENPWFYLPGGVRSKRQALTFAFAAGRELRSIKADAVYATSVPILSVIPVGLHGAFRKKPLTFIEWFEIWPFKYWIEYSGLIAGVIGWLTQFTALQIGKFRIVYTQRALNSIRRSSLPLNKKNIIELPGLCDPIFTHPVQESEKRTDITFLGRFVDEKQPTLAIESVIEFIKSGWSGKFWIIGKGPSIDSMKDLLKRNHFAANQIEILENASDEIVKDHLKSSFVLLHPSKREGYGLASVEAAYLGTPSILLNYPNNATLDLGISPELTVNDLSPTGIASKLHHAYIEQSQIRKTTLNWAENAARHRSIVSTADRIEELLGVSNV